MELQAQLHSLDPSRGSESHVAMNVLAIKLDFLRSRSFRSVDTAAHFSKYDAASHGKLVPKLEVDKSKDLTPITADVTGADDDDVDTDVMDADDTDAMDADVVDTNPLDVGVEPDPNSPSYYAPDAAFLSEGSAAVLPCTIRFMDLTVLKLEHLIRVPHVMLIRDDWRDTVDIFNRRRKGTLGSAIVTGQPGIGEHYCAWPPIFNQCTSLRRQNLPFVPHPFPLHYPSPANRVSGQGGSNFLHWR